MQRRVLKATLLLVTLGSLVLGLASTPVPAYADGSDPPPAHRDTGDTTGSGNSVPDYGTEESNLSSEVEPDLWDVVLFTLKAII